MQTLSQRLRTALGMQPRRVTITRLIPKTTLTIIVASTGLEVLAYYDGIRGWGYGSDAQEALDSLHEFLGVQWDALVCCPDDQLTVGARKARNDLIRAFKPKETSK